MHIGTETVIENLRPGVVLLDKTKREVNISIINLGQIQNTDDDFLNV